jgi:hypothetical protein
MKSIIASTIALAFAGAQFVAMPAYAEQPASFRSVEAQKFSSEDLQRYGMSKAAADHGAALQNQGYKVMVLSKEDAAKYQAGITDNQWLLLGILAGVIVIAVAVAD